MPPCLFWVFDFACAPPDLSCLFLHVPTLPPSLPRSPCHAYVPYRLFRCVVVSISQVSVDMGAAWIHGTDGNPVTTLCKKFSLSLFNTGSPTLFVDFNGRCVLPFLLFVFNVFLVLVLVTALLPCWWPWSWSCCWSCFALPCLAHRSRTRLAPISAIN